MTVVHEIAPSSAVSQIVDGASGVLLPDPTDLDGIVDPKARGLSEMRALRAARELLLNHRKYGDMTQTLELMRAQRSWIRRQRRALLSFDGPRG
jgi:hypothetical protein